MRWLAAAAIAAGLCALPGPAAAARGPGRVTMITDSVGGVLYWVRPALDELSDGLDLQLETKTCRKLVAAGCWAYDESPPSALETVQQLGHELGAVLIVDVGYNDLAADYADGLDQVMHAALDAGVHRVVWVTLEEREHAWVEINAKIRAATARWPQLVVADWGAASAGQPWFVDDAHMSAVGGVQFARFLRPIVLEACGAACPIAGLPRGRRPT